MMIRGIGTDIVSKERIKNSNVEEKFLNSDELEILNNLNGEEKIDFISGRWAAKESIIKASGKEITFSQISILKEDSGAPIVLIDGKKDENIKISISHEKDYTVAFSVITKV